MLNNYFKFVYLPCFIRHARHRVASVLVSDDYLGAIVHTLSSCEHGTSKDGALWLRLTGTRERIAKCAIIYVYGVYIYLQ